MAIPLVDGLRLTERAEDVGSGELWYARVTGGLGGERGDPMPGELPGVGGCLVRLLRLPVDEALRSRARALAGDLIALEDPGLVRISSVREAHDGVALVFAAPPQPVLALSLLARRRQLAAGEIVTLGVAVSWALAAAHRRGLTHGRLRDADVLIDAEGRPVLAGVGVSGVLGSPGLAEEDVAALARLLGSLMDGASSGAGRVERVLADRSLAAAELAAALAAAVPSTPIELSPPEATEPGPAAEPPGPEPAQRRLRLRRAGLIVGAAAGTVLLAGIAGWASVSSPSSSQPPDKASPSVSATAHAGAAGGSGGQVPAADWSAVLAALDEQRAAAFARSAGVSMAAADAPAGTAYAYDVSALASLRDRGAHAIGLRLQLGRVKVTSSTSRRVVLDVTDRRLPYELRDSRDGLIQRVTARSTARHLIELRDIGLRAVDGSAMGLDSGPGRPAQWRIWKVTDLVGQPS